MASHIERRKFLATLLGGGAASWPLAARAQQRERMRRIGVLLPAAADDADFQAWVGAFQQALVQSGWIIGRNVRIDTRWAGANADDIRRHAAELVALGPEVILAYGTSTVRPLLQTTRTVPIVFPVIADPVGAGLVDSLARPGGNATGFMTEEYSFSGKWLALLKEIAPSVTRVAVNLTDAGDIERAFATVARSPNGGLVVVPGGRASSVHRHMIVTLAAQYKLPAVYFSRVFVTGGGLISYAADYVDQFQRAAGYVDRILKGEKPADLPVHAPTKYELVINLKAAKALGLDIPPALLARADEVIE